MTLILTVANSRGVYQSSDYQLTDLDTGAPVSDRAGSKQLEAGFKGLHLQLAFTGIAVIGRGSSAERTIDWLSAELKALPHDSELQTICNSLSKRGTAAMKPHGPRGVLTLVLAVATVGEPFRVAVISNARWGVHPPCAKNNFDIAIHTIKKPFHLISGYRDSVPRRDQHRLRALARAAHRPPGEILDALTAINAVAARNSRGYVSEGCWVTSQVADGRVRRTASRNVGDHGGSIPQLLHGLGLSDWIKKNYRAAPGKEIRLVQSAGVIAGPGDGVPVPPPEGDPRSFRLSGSSVTGMLRSPSAQHCASIEIVQLECVITARRNEEVIIPFAQVQLSGTHAICSDCPRPLFPWPTISPALAIDGAALPRGWEHSVGYWTERGVHHVEIPRSSRSIRGLAFLGDDDELGIATVSESQFAWGASEDGPTAMLQARVLWRTRLDGTRG